MKRTSIALCIALLATGGAALAQTPAPKPTAEDARQLGAFFKEIDADRNQRLTKVEMSVFAQRHKLGVFVKNRSWRILDADGNGTLDLNEFVEGMVKLRAEWTAEQKAKAK